MYQKEGFDRHSKRILRKSKGLLREIKSYREDFSRIPDGFFRLKTASYRRQLENGSAAMDDLLPEAFALVYEAVRRVTGMELHDVQLLAGILLHGGRIAEAATGEGKTLSAVAPSYLNALPGRGVHVITVNDYLANRDAEEMGRIHAFLGLTTGCIQNGMNGPGRKAAYGCDVTYVTNAELGFDYLRDNMATDASARVLRPFSYGIIDEVDSILIDEARTPLIISGAADTPVDLYRTCSHVAKRLVPGTRSGDLTKLDILSGNRREESGDFITDEKDQVVYLTEEGTRKVEAFFGISNFADASHMDLQHHMQMALKAWYLFHRDKDYVVTADGVQIVDEFTGRILPGRRYSDGLHQAIEAKEGVPIRNESRTFATITYQNLFNQYPKKAGMTGTAMTEAREFRDIYGMDVVRVPTDRPVIREDLEDMVFLSKRAKYQAIADEVEAQHLGNGRPILIGTPDIRVSEELSRYLRGKDIPHEVLNAKQHEREAEIISHAGEFGAVTIATNMAGRGTDIKLDARAREAGGLLVIGAERHEARRIDNQLRGRSGRQGDQGTSRFYLSLEDDMMRLFAPEGMLNLFRGLVADEAVPLEHKRLSRVIRKAQQNIEGNHFGVRKHLVDYDVVDNTQREAVYGQRNRILEGDSVHGIAMDMADDLAWRMVEDISASGDPFPVLERCAYLLGTGASLPEESLAGPYLDGKSKRLLHGVFRCLFRDRYDACREGFPDRDWERRERDILLRVLDNHWMRHLRNLDVLRQDIALVGYGQQDPVVAYKLQACELFDTMIRDVGVDTLHFLFRPAGAPPGTVEEPVSHEPDGPGVSVVLLGGRGTDPNPEGPVHREPVQAGA